MREEVKCQVNLANGEEIMGLHCKKPNNQITLYSVPKTLTLNLKNVTTQKIFGIFV